MSEATPLFEPTEAENEEWIEFVNDTRDLKNLTMPYEVIERTVIPEHLEKLVRYYMRTLCANNDALLHVIKKWKEQGSAVASPELTKITQEMIAMYGAE